MKTARGFDFKADDLQHLNQEFINGTIVNLPERLTISDVQFNYISSNNVDFSDLVNRNKLGLVLFVIDRSTENIDLFNKVGKTSAEEPGLHPWVILAWKQKNASVVPYGIKSTTEARARTIQSSGSTGSRIGGNHPIDETAATPAQETAAQKKDKEWQSRVLGKTTSLSFPQFSRSKTVKAKVDTGANVSSIHAEDIQVDERSGTVVCKIPALGGDNTIRMKVETQQAVRSSDGGTEYRPVVLLNVTINGKTLEGVEFNLNNRAHMNHDVLVGHNILEKAGFIIDPTLESEDVNWDELENLFEGHDFEMNHTLVEMTATDVYQIIANNNISFDAILEAARTAGVESVDSIQA